MSNDAFYYIGLINTKSEIPDDLELKLNYLPFLSNRNFSYTIDTVLMANEMNRFPDCSKVLQFKYLFHAIKKRKRFAKWTKPPKPSLDFLIVKKYYGYNIKNTEIAMKLLTKEQLKIIKSKMNIGGDKKRNYAV